MNDRSAYMIVRQIEKLEREIKSQRRDQILSIVGLLFSVIALIINMCSDNISACARMIMVCVLISITALIGTYLIASMVVRKKKEKDSLSFTSGPILLSPNINLQIHAIIECYNNWERNNDDTIRKYFSSEIRSHIKSICKHVETCMYYDETYPMGTGEGGKDFFDSMKILSYFNEKCGLEISELRDIEERAKRRLNKETEKN